MPDTRETCGRCGKQWGVTTEPRADVLCTDCASTPRPPEGEVRISHDGVTVVCLGGDRYLRWKVIGSDASDTVMAGWRADCHVLDYQRIGNVYDLKEAVRDAH